MTQFSGGGGSLFPGGIFPDTILYIYLPEDIISFYPNEKYLIVQSSNINPDHCIIAVLKGKGLKVTSARKLFFAIN